MLYVTGRYADGKDMNREFPSLNAKFQKYGNEFNRCCNTDFTGLREVDNVINFFNNFTVDFAFNYHDGAKVVNRYVGKMVGKMLIDFMCQFKRKSIY